MAQADPAPRTRTRAARTPTAASRPAAARPTRPAARAPSPACGSSRRASSAAPTTGRASRSSARSSTSACSRSSRATRSRASSTRWSRCCRRSRTTPARLGRRGGFITRLREGTWVGHVAEHIALEFQNLAGTDVRHGKTRGTGEYGRYNVIFEYREEQVGIEAGKAAVGLVNHLVAPSDPAVAFDLMAELEKLIRLAERLAFGPSTQALLDEAAGRDIPYIRLDRFSLVQLGPGRPPAADPRDDDLADRAASPSTSRPTRSSPTGSSTRRDCPFRAREVVETEDEAVAAAKRLGYPCVRQAARRQPRPRRRPEPPDRGRGPRRVRRRAAAEPERRRRRRDLHHRQRLPRARDRRQARGGRGARPGQRHRRRRAHDPPARRRRPTPTRGAASATRRC